jgi:glyoxylase-like metal-dependent hydrolase (beta-lactamase superfamily II)
MTVHHGIFTSDRMGDYLSAVPAMSVERLSPRLWTISDGVRRAMFVEGRRQVIAFDTFGTPGSARAYRAAIAKAIPGKTIGTVIYTHDHLDHAGYAAELAPGADIIADQMTAQVVQRRAASGQSPVTRALSGDRHVFNIDGVELHLLNPGPTHGSGNLSAYFAAEKLLYSSDTILPNARYGFLPDYHLANFVSLMRTFLELEFQTFVPGRFQVTDVAHFSLGCDYLDAVHEVSQRAFNDMVPIWVLDAMAGYCKPALQPRFGSLEGFDEHVGRTCLRVVHHYLMGGYGPEDTPAPRPRPRPG